MPNNSIREQLKEADMRLWQLADALRVSEPTIVRWMRHELSEEKKREIDAAIRSFKKDQEGK